MATAPERGILFVTAPAPLTARILADVRARFPFAVWTICVSAADREALGDAIAGLETIEPDGPRWALLRTLQRGRYDVAILAWTGSRRPRSRMKLAGLLAAPSHWIYNENLDYFRIGVVNRSWLGHVRWRLGLHRGFAPSVLVSLFLFYRWTLGLAVGAVVCGVRFARWRVRRS